MGVSSSPGRGWSCSGGREVPAPAQFGPQRDPAAEEPEKYQTIICLKITVKVLYNNQYMETGYFHDTAASDVSMWVKNLHEFIKNGPIFIFALYLISHFIFHDQ